MSKNHKKAKTTISSFALSVKPVPTGKVSLAEFIGSEAAEQAVRSVLDLDLEHSEKAFAILCSYQTFEVCNELELAGRFELLDNEAFQEHMVDWVEKIVRENFIEMLMAVGGELSNFLAQAQEKGGV